MMVEVTPTTVPQRLAQRVAATPDAMAFQSQRAGGGWQPITWQAFGQQVSGLRRGLAAAGLQKGDRLALVAPVSLDWELVHHAALSMGVAVVGLDAHDLPERLANMANQAQVVAVAAVDLTLLSAMSPQQRAAIRLWINLGSQPGVGHHSLTSLRALGADTAEPSAPHGDTEATVIFTSGTTGAPKGIAYSHAQLGMAIDAISEAFAFVRTDGRLLCWLPLSNLFQRVVNLAAIQNGAGTYLLGDPRQVMAHVAHVEPDVFIGVPRFFEKLHEGIVARVQTMAAPMRALVGWAWRIGHQALARKRSGLPLPWALTWQHRLADRFVLRRIRGVMGTRLRCLVSGSAPLPPDLLEAFEALGWPLLEAYGLSENVLPMAMNRLGDCRPGTVGRPLPGNDIRMDAQGMVWVRGPGVFAGYLGDVPGAALDAEGYYATGDLGRLDADGYLRLTGRLSDMIKTSTGRRIAPAGVEAVLQAVDGIDQAVLLGAGRKYLVALCTCLPGALAAEGWPRLQQSVAEAAQRVNTHERPAGVLVMEEAFSMAHGELTPNLKLRRVAIAERHAERIDWLCTQIAQRGAADGAAPLILTAPKAAGAA